MGVGQSFYSVRKFVARVLVCTMLGTTAVSVPQVYAKQTVTAPQITKSEVDILVGGTYDLNIKNKVKNSTYKWTTSNKKVATVSKVGVVKGISKGKVTITCNVKTPNGTYKLTSKVTVREGAEEFKINNKVTALTVGQYYNLNRDLSPITSNDLTTWTSSNPEIAKPDKRGKFTALKEGSVTITGKTMSGKSDSVKIIVFDEDGTVTNQEELDAILASGIKNVIIKTNDETTFEIPDGIYNKKSLVVDAPNADVINSAKFKSIEIKHIKATTWYEKAVGNTINVSAPKARLVIEENAKAKIVVNSDNVNLDLVNNSNSESELIINGKATINISGSSTTPLNVIANSNATITTSIPLNLTCNSKIELNLLPGAENTVITVSDEAFIPVNIGTIPFTVIVGTGSNARIITVSSSNGTSSGYYSGGNSGGNPGSNPGGGSDVSETYGQVSGKITVENSDEPVALATVYLKKSTASTTLNDVVNNYDRKLLANDNGEYSVSSLAPGEYIIAAQKIGFEDYNNKVTVTANTTTTFNFSMRPSAVIPVNTGKLVGRVVAYDPVTGGAIEITGGAIEVSGGAIEVTGGAIEVTGGAIEVSDDYIDLTGDAKPVANANIYVIKYDGNVNIDWESLISNPNIFARTDENGYYQIADLEPGNYLVVMAKEGYRILNQITTVSDNATTVVNGILIAMTENSDISKGIASGKLYNALTGELVDTELAFTINVYKGFDNTDENDLVKTELVHGSKYALTLPEGYYTILVKDNREDKTGVTYAPTTMNVVVLGGTIFSNQDVVLATLKEDGEATFVLTWGRYPEDLDSHLIGPVSYNGEYEEKYHIYYGNKEFPYDVDESELHLRLDRDDRESYGPETTSIYVPVENGIYTFVVFNYDYSDSEHTLGDSGAKVVVTTSKGTYTFEVPTGATQNTWVVCSYNSKTGDITPINTLVDVADDYDIPDLF